MVAIYGALCHDRFVTDPRAKVRRQLRAALIKYEQVQATARVERDAAIRAAREAGLSQVEIIEETRGLPGRDKPYSRETIRLALLPAERQEAFREKRRKTGA